jgi:Ca-activated chloride channel family protein
MIRPTALLFIAAILVSSAPVAADEPPLAMLVATEALGAGQNGTVVGVVIQIAPEDIERAGERLRVVTARVHDGEVEDRQSAVVALEADGTILLYREWPVGTHEIRVSAKALDSNVGGIWIGDVEVPEMLTPFEAPEGAPVEAIALAVTPPREGAVRFRAPPDSGGIGALQLQVDAPEGTASVSFYQDQTLLITRNRSPWTVSVSLGDVVKRTRVRAVARDAQGRYLGEDALVLNNPTGRVGVEVLIGPDEAVVDGRRPITVSVNGGSGAIDQVSLGLDDRIVARWARCPCVAEVADAELQRATIITAEAVDSKGNRGDAVVTLDGGGGFVGLVEVELVELPITVLDPSGAPVAGLEQTAFTVFEDAQEVAVEGFGTTEDLPLSIALAVDTSGSMIESYGSVLRAIDAFAVNLMRPGDEATALTFAWEAIVQVRWTDDAEAVMPQLERIQPEGGTSLHDAVVKSLEQFRGRRGQQALILLTDGEDTTSRTGWDLALRFAHTMRIPIFPIGLGMSRFDYSQRKTLRRLAEETGGEAFFPKDTGELSAAYGRIGDLLRSQYLLWYSSNSAKPAEAFRAIEVRVPGRPEATVRTIRGYYPGK